jgi:hypothetical protein
MWERRLQCHNSYFLQYLLYSIFLCVHYDHKFSNCRNLRSIYQICIKIEMLTREKAIYIFNQLSTHLILLTVQNTQF